MSMNSHFYMLANINSLISTDMAFILLSPLSMDTDMTELSVYHIVQTDKHTDSFSVLCTYVAKDLYNPSLS